jgi:nitrogen regulatory protein P-II 1
MTRIDAYIRTQFLEDLQDALDDLDVSGLTVIDVRGRGHTKGITHTYRGSQYTMTLAPRIKLEILLTDEQVEEVVEAIRKVACTGEMGDGKIVLVPVSDVIRIRTGERGDAALK